MGRVFTILAMLLVLIDLLLFLFAIAGYRSEAFASIAQPIVCRSEESFRVKDGNINMYCEVGEKSRDVTGLVMSGLIGGFVGSFILSMIFAVVGRNMTARQQIEYYTNMIHSFKVRTDVPTVIDMRDGTAKYSDTPQEAIAVMQTVLDSLNMNMSDFQQQTLTQRLQQLQDALHQGLLTQTEYDRVRTSIIDRLDD